MADPIVDVVGFMQDVLAEQACQSVDVTKTVDGDLEANLEESSSPMNSPNAGSWTSVEAVMEVLEKGARRYRIKREALRLDAKEDEYAGVAEAAAAAAGTEAFVYEESDDATAFFLPYTWSLAVDLTIDLRWEHEEIVLFPTMPYFESWKEQDELLETDEAQAVETHGLPPI